MALHRCALGLDIDMVGLSGIDLVGLDVGTLTAAQVDALGAWLRPDATCVSGWSTPLSRTPSPEPTASSSGGCRSFVPWSRPTCSTVWCVDQHRLRSGWLEHPGGGAPVGCAGPGCRPVARAARLLTPASGQPSTRLGSLAAMRGFSGPQPQRRHPARVQPKVGEWGPGTSADYLCQASPAHLGQASVSSPH